MVAVSRVWNSLPQHVTALHLCRNPRLRPKFRKHSFPVSRQTLERYDNKKPKASTAHQNQVQVKFKATYRGYIVPMIMV